MHAAILAGGVGTRLWPRSRQAHPKQFADITGHGRTMIQATVDRLEGLVAPDATWVITGESYAELARAQLPALPPAQIVAEPSGRNTAPAIALACLHLRRVHAQAVLAILPADHVIAHADSFRAALARAAQAAQAGWLVTLGVEPTFPHTGYGYIKRGESVALPAESGAEALPVYRVQRFLEKPERAVAEAFLHEGGYYWNGGIFVFRVDVMLAEFTRQMPELARLLDAFDQAQAAGDSATAAGLWAQMPSISIDHGIFEGAQQVAMTPLNAGWNDVGSWDALESVLESDESNNSVAGGNVVTVQSYNNIVFTTRQVVALVGVDDLVIVEDGDALLIGHKRQMQNVKLIVDALRAQGRVGLY